MVSVRGHTEIVVVAVHMKSAPAIIQSVSMKKLSSPNKKAIYNNVHLFAINLLAVYGECGGNFFSCSHDYDVCNDDKKEC